MEEKGLPILSVRLRDLRYSLDVSQTEFVEGIGITAASLSGYEKNNKTPSAKIVKKIAEKYNVSIDWLCGLSDDRQINQDIRTYSAFFKMLLRIKETNGIRSELEVDANKSGILFNDDVMLEIFENWNKMLSSYNSHLIDDEILKLWEEKTIRKLDYPIKGSD